MQPERRKKKTSSINFRPTLSGDRKQWGMSYTATDLHFSISLPLSLLSRSHPPSPHLEPCGCAIDRLTCVTISSSGGSAPYSQSPSQIEFLWQAFSHIKAASCCSVCSAFLWLIYLPIRVCLPICLSACLSICLFTITGCFPHHFII